MIKSNRIMICGPSGVGKSTIAQFISHSLKIPFITTSTKPLWDKHNISTHKELIDKGAKDPKWGLDFQYEVLNYRREKVLAANEGLNTAFVTDRSPIDNLAYFLMQNTTSHDEEVTEKYRKRCAEDLLEQTSKIIRIKFCMDQNLENDGKRIDNRYYQLMTDGVFESIFQNDLLNISQNFKKENILVIDQWDITNRIAMIQDFLEIPNKRKSKIQRWFLRNKW